MTEFRLWKSSKKALPDTVMVDGGAFSVNTDFKTILKIFAILDDPEILDAHKGAQIVRLFFRDAAPARWEDAFGWFVRCGDAPNPAQETPRGFDYDFDAPEIYASFLHLYGIDLLQENLHWWQFCALLAGCCLSRCPLAEKLRIRTLDVSKCADKAAAQRAKDSVQIPERIGATERMTRDRILERLARGESVADLIGG